MNSAFEQTDIGLIPEDWANDTIGNHFDIKQGKQLSKLTRVGNNQKKFLRTANVFWGTLDLSELDEMNFTKEEEEKLKLRYNDLLVCEGGDIGRTAIWRNDLEDCYYQNHIHRLRLKKETISPLFFMNWMYYGVVLANKYFGIGNRTTIPNLSASRLKSFQFPLPPLSEQKKIAHILSKIQFTIETQEQIIKTTQELKKALMQKLFTKGLNGEPQKMTEIGLIPESWEVIKLEATGDVVYGIQASVAHLTKPIGLPILTNKNITFDGIIDLSELNYFELRTKRHFDTILKKGDILFNWRSGSIAHVGKTAYFDLDGEYVHSSFILRIRPKENINNKYLFYFLTHLRLSDYFIKLHSYSINAKFNKSAVNKLPTVIPSPREQLSITNYLSNIDNKIILAETILINKKNLFTSLLNNLMTGQVRVKDVEFEIEESLEGINA